MKTRVNLQHDYITLTLTVAPKNRVNLTISRSGEKISAPTDVPPATLKRLFRAFCGLLKVGEKVGKTYGQTVDLLATLADPCADLDAVVTAWERAATAGAAVTALNAK